MVEYEISENRMLKKTLKWVQTLAMKIRSISFVCYIVEVEGIRRLVNFIDWNSYSTIR